MTSCLTPKSRGQLIRGALFDNTAKGVESSYVVLLRINTHKPIYASCIPIGYNSDSNSNSLLECTVPVGTRTPHGAM